MWSLACYSKEENATFPFGQTRGLNVTEITLKYLSLSIYPVQTNGLSGHARTCRPDSGHFSYKQHLYRNRIVWLPSSHPLRPPCLKPWSVKALKSDLSSITDNSFTWASCLFSHSSLCNYVISWAYHRWSHEAISEMTVSICVYVCMSLRSATCWHMYLSLIVIKLCARPHANC